MEKDHYQFDCLVLFQRATTIRRVIEDRIASGGARDRKDEFTHRIVKMTCFVDDRFFKENEGQLSVED